MEQEIMKYLNKKREGKELTQLDAAKRVKRNKMIVTRIIDNNEPIDVVAKDVRLSVEGVKRIIDIAKDERTEEPFRNKIKQLIFNEGKSVDEAAEILNEDSEYVRHILIYNWEIKLLLKKAVAEMILKEGRRYEEVSEHFQIAVSTVYRYVAQYKKEQKK